MQEDPDDETAIRNWNGDPPPKKLDAGSGDEADEEDEEEQPVSRPSPSLAAARSAGLIPLAAQPALVQMIGR